MIAAYVVVSRISLVKADKVRFGISSRIPIRVADQKLSILTYRSKRIKAYLKYMFLKTGEAARPALYDVEIVKANSCSAPKLKPLKTK